MPPGRVFRFPAGRQGRVPDPERGNRVEGETPAQVVGIVGRRSPMRVRTLSAWRNRSIFRRGAGGVETGRAPGGERHPVQRLAPPLSGAPFGRVPLKDGDGNHVDGSGVPPVLRGRDVHRRAARRRPCRAPSPVAAGGRTSIFRSPRTERHGAHCGPSGRIQGGRDSEPGREIM